MTTGTNTFPVSGDEQMTEQNNTEQNNTEQVPAKVPTYRDVLNSVISAHATLAPMIESFNKTEYKILNVEFRLTKNTAGAVTGVINTDNEYHSINDAINEKIVEKVIPVKTVELLAAEQAHYSAIVEYNRFCAEKINPFRLTAKAPVTSAKPGATSAVKGVPAEKKKQEVRQMLQSINPGVAVEFVPDSRTMKITFPGSATVHEYDVHGQSWFSTLYQLYGPKKVAAVV